MLIEILFAADQDTRRAEYSFSLIKDRHRSDVDVKNGLTIEDILVPGDSAVLPDQTDITSNTSSVIFSKYQILRLCCKYIKIKSNRRLCKTKVGPR
jgi:hypothetical protein